MNWKSTVFVSGAGLVATWFGVVSAPPAVRSSTPQAAQSAPGTTSAAITDIEQQAAHLQTRLHGDTTFRAPSRNPFRFANRPAPKAQPVPAPIVLPPPPPEPPRPRFTLAGIATDVVDGKTERTAIVSSPGTGVALVKEGDAVGDYRVTKIDDESVELAAADGASLRLALAK